MCQVVHFLLGVVVACLTLLLPCLSNLFQGSGALLPAPLRTVFSSEHNCLQMVPIFCRAAVSFPVWGSLSKDWLQAGPSIILLGRLSSARVTPAKFLTQVSGYLLSWYIHHHFSGVRQFFFCQFLTTSTTIVEGPGFV